MSLSFQLRRPLRFDSFTIEEALTHVLVNEVAKRRPKTVIEFGSGMSTVLIAKVIDVLGLETKFLSFEEDERYMKRTLAWLKAEGLAERAKVIHAPIENQGPDMHPWYAEIAFDHIMRIDELQAAPVFMFVDGPVSRDESPSRYDCDCGVRWPALALTSWLWQLPGSAVLIDDTKRDAATVQHWRRDFDDVQWTEIETERGAMLVEPRPQPKTPDDEAIGSAA